MKLTDKQCQELYRYIEGEGHTPGWLYEHYLFEMPYGVQKARDGDPENWLAENLDKIRQDFSEEIERGRLNR